MPSPVGVTKQHGGSGSIPPRKVAGQVAKDSLLSRAVDVSDLDMPDPSILMYGGNRVGKTTIASKFDKPTLFITFEPTESGGIESIRKEKGVKVLQYGVHFKDCNEAVGIAHELEGNHGFKWVVIDSATSLQDKVLTEILGPNRNPTTLSWGTVDSGEYRMRSERVREILRPFLALKMGRIILAKERDHNPPKEERVNEKTGKTQPDMRPKFIRGLQQESFVAADLGGATAGWLQDACDCICRLSVDKEVVVEKRVVNGKTVETENETGRYVRYLRMTYHPNFAAGIRCATPSNVPDFLVDATPEGLAKKLIALLKE